MFNRSRNQGFTLLELVFASAIALILLAMTSVAMRPAIEQEGPLGLAYSLAADLRAARSEAMRGGRTVAFCFASEHRTNSLTRSAHIRVGDQKGKVWRSVGYESEYDATIFIGRWGTQDLERFDIPSGWAVSTAKETALYFAPDGHAYSEDIYPLDGRYPLVVASGFAGNFQGPMGTLSSARNPQTVWVSQSGTIEVETGKLPLGILPAGIHSELTVAKLEPETADSGSSPTILSSVFMPEQIEGLPSSGIGQNYVQIHPNQREGQQLEYGLATIEVKAEDIDGGPLTYELSAEASSGDVGKFSVSRQVGDMSFVYDEATHKHLWKTVVSWRPPPSAPIDLNYQLSLTVRDPQGNFVVASTKAGLLPSVTSLPPARIVVCSTDKKLFLTNLDGANEVLITRSGAEYSPFFSQDGSCLFSFHDFPGTGNRELRSRPANGSIGFSRLAGFRGSSSDVIVDPTYTFAALINPAGDFAFDWGQVTSSTSDSSDEDGGGSTTTYSFHSDHTEVPVSNVLILNLMASDPPVVVTRQGTGEFFWAANARHTFYFGEEVPLPKITEQGFGPFSPQPGYETVKKAKYLVGFPPHAVDSDVAPVSATGRLYSPANRDWYLIVEGSQLSVRNDLTGESRVLYSSPAGFEKSAFGRANPSWSADGEQVAFVASPGPSAKVVSMHALDANFQLQPTTIKFEENIPHASHAQLSPTGKWIYFLKGPHLLRAENTTGRELIDIAKHLDVDIEDYVISP